MLKLQNKSFFIGLSLAILFLFLRETGIMYRLLLPYFSEASIYADTVIGVVVFFYILPITAFISTAVAALASEKKKRVRAGLVAGGSFLMIAAIGLTFEYLYHKIRLAQDFQLAREKSLVHPSQESQNLPASDRARPITILNQIESSKSIEIKPNSAFRVKAIIREDLISIEDRIVARLMVFTPGSTQRNFIAETELKDHGNLSSDGRRIFEGDLMLTRPTDAHEGYLSVNTNGITDAISVIIRK